MSFPNTSHSQLYSIFRDVASGVFVDPNLLHHALIQTQMNRPDLVLERNEANRIAATYRYYPQNQQQQQQQQQQACTSPQQQLTQMQMQMQTQTQTKTTPAQDAPHAGTEQDSKKAAVDQVKNMHDALAPQRQAQQQWQEAARRAYWQAQQETPQPPSQVPSLSQSNSKQQSNVPAQGRAIPSPPKNQHWLITDPEFLSREKVLLQQMTAKWLDGAKLPDSNDRQAKVEWLRLLGQVAAKSETTLQVSLAKHAAEAAARALYESSPVEVTLTLFCPSTNLEYLVDVDNAALQEEMARYRQAKKRSGAEPSTVFLGSILCRKTDELPSKANDLAQSLGLEINSITLQGQGVDIPCYFGLNPKIGENLYFDDKEGKAVIQILGQVTPRTAWRNQLDEMKKQTEVDGKATKIFTLVEKPLPPPPTTMTTERHANAAASTNIFAPETHQCLWLPAKFPRVMQNVRDHLHFGASESIQIQSRLQKGTPQAAQLKLAIFKQELQAIKKMRGWPSKLINTLALTMAVSEDPRWMCGIENVGAVGEVMDQLSTYWRSTLLAKTDEVLGIGAPDEGRSETSGSSGSRAALYTVLQLLAKRFDLLLGGGLVRLKWQPKPHKKKRSKPAPPVKASNAENSETITLFDEQPPNKKQKLSGPPSTEDDEESKVSPTSVFDNATFFPYTDTKEPLPVPTNQKHGPPPCWEI